jgi:hypothetical protein
MVSYRVARTGKPHTIVDDFILPAAADMAGTMLGERPKKLYLNSDDLFTSLYVIITYYLVQFFAPFCCEVLFVL